MKTNNEVFRIVACSPPSCGCPELSVEQDVDGNEVVIITDDFNGVSIMSVVEFTILAEEFLKRR